MSYFQKNINRRGFLQKSAVMTAGCLLGFNSFSKTLAFEESNKDQTGSRIALIIDDIGYSVSRARRFLDLGVPLTFSILPRLADSVKLSLEIKKSGHEIMLHQPMEPYDPALNPGPGALYAGDGEEYITSVIEENNSEIPFAAGINNHM